MYKLRNILSLLILIAFATGSCKNIFRKDLSLTEKEYASKGMPDIRKVWGENELIKAHVTLGSLRTKNFLTLPVKGSRKSGKVFSRIVSKENLSFLDDTSKALHDKAYEIQTMASFQNEISRMYTDELKKEQYYNKELIEIYVFEIYLRGKMLELAEKILNSRDPADMAMSSGGPAIVGGYVNLITTLLREQLKTKSYSSAELRSLSKEVLKSIHENLKYLDSGSKQKLSSEIGAITEKITSGNVRHDLADMLKFLSE